MSNTQLAIVIFLLVYFGAVFGFAILSAKLAENWPVSNLDPEQAASLRLRKKLLGEEVVEVHSQASNETIWLAPTPEAERRRARCLKWWQFRYCWGGTLIIIAAAAFHYALMNAQYWWSIAMALFMLVWLCEKSLRSARQTSISAHLTLGVSGHQLLLQNEQGRCWRYGPEKLGFDGSWLNTPHHRVKLTRRANKQEAAKLGCKRMPLFDREAFLRYVYPILDHPEVVDREPKKERAPGDRIDGIAHLILSLGFFLSLFGLSG